MKAGRTLYGKPIRTLHEFFSAIDTDGSGTVDQPEMSDAFRRLDVGLSEEEVLNRKTAAFMWSIAEQHHLSLNRLACRWRQIMYLLRNMDIDGNGRLSYFEFLSELTRYDMCDSQVDLSDEQAVSGRH